MIEPEDGISPQTAGTLLTIVALLGIGLYAMSVMLETKSPDPLYDPDNLESHTSSKLMETPDLWKGKKTSAVFVLIRIRFCKCERITFALA